MEALRVSDVAKSFRVPVERRDTVREHALSVFRSRPHRVLSVLDGVSFAVRKGETIGIMGRNGSGKSTLLKIITGIYRPDRGFVDCSLPITPILELGVGWNQELDALDNIYLLGTVMGMRLRDLKTEARRILEFAGVEEFAHLELRYYSSGMASRLAYSVAFHAVRGLLILDEVFAVGDAEFRERCYERYLELHDAGHTVLLVSHNPSDIRRFCERALLIDKGVIAAEGSGEEIAELYLGLAAAPESTGEAQT